MECAPEQEGETVLLLSVKHTGGEKELKCVKQIEPAFAHLFCCDRNTFEGTFINSSLSYIITQHYRKTILIGQIAAFCGEIPRQLFFFFLFYMDIASFVSFTSPWVLFPMEACFRH